MSLKPMTVQQGIIRDLSRNVGVTLPNEYENFLKLHNMATDERFNYFGAAPLIGSRFNLLNSIDRYKSLPNFPAFGIPLFETQDEKHMFIYDAKTRRCYGYDYDSNYVVELKCNLNDVVEKAGKHILTLSREDCIPQTTALRIAGILKSGFQMSKFNEALAMAIAYSLPLDMNGVNFYNYYNNYLAERTEDMVEDIADAVLLDNSKVEKMVREIWYLRCEFICKIPKNLPEEEFKFTEDEVTHLNKLKDILEAYAKA